MEDQSETNTMEATQPVAAIDTEPAEVKATPETLTAIIKLLEPLSSAQRQRTVAAAMMFLGEAPLQKPSRQQEASGGGAGTANDDGEAQGGYPAQITKWMNQNNVSAEELDRVFHFHQDGTFDLLHAPGKSKREQTLNTYTLSGLGKYLAANDRTFDDATARGFCETIGCFDAGNHAKHLKGSRSEFSGDKTKGYSLTNVGIKRGAVLVKEVAGG
jgi:hypothetical protein